MNLKSTFETEYACAGDGTVLGFARREAPSLSTVVFAGHEQSGEWRARIAPGPVRQVVARAGRSWLLLENAVYETRDAGRTFATFPLPSGRHSGLAAAEDGPWVVSRDRQVLARRDDAWVVRWEAPALPSGELLARLIPVGRGILALTNRLRVLRGLDGDPTLRDYGENLPAPLSGGAHGAANVHVIDDTYFAYAGRLYLRKSTDACWSLAADAKLPELAGVVASNASEWVRTPWARDVWIGHDGLQIFESGPGRPLSPVWRPLPGAPQTSKNLVVGATTVLVSFRRALPALSGLVIGERGIEEVRLPVD